MQIGSVLHAEAQVEPATQPHSFAKSVLNWLMPMPVVDTTQVSQSMAVVHAVPQSAGPVGIVQRLPPEEDDETTVEEECVTVVVAPPPAPPEPPLLLLQAAIAIAIAETTTAPNAQVLFM
jgi:hypothetical protein